MLDVASPSWGETFLSQKLQLFLKMGEGGHSGGVANPSSLGLRHFLSQKLQLFLKIMSLAISQSELNAAAHAQLTYLNVNITNKEPVLQTPQGIANV